MSKRSVIDGWARDWRWWEICCALLVILYIKWRILYWSWRILYYNDELLCLIKRCFLALRRVGRRPGPSSGWRLRAVCDWRALWTTRCDSKRRILISYWKILISYSRILISYSRILISWSFTYFKKSFIYFKKTGPSVHAAWVGDDLCRKSAPLRRCDSIEFPLFSTVFRLVSVYFRLILVYCRLILVYFRLILVYFDAQTYRLRSTCSGQH